MGTEAGAESLVNLVQEYSASGGGTSISIAWPQSTVAGNTLVMVCVTEATSNIDCMTDSSYVSRYQFNTESGISIAVFVRDNSSSVSGNVDFLFGSSVAARGFVFEFSGLSTMSYIGSATSTANDSNPSTSSVTSQLDYGALVLGNLSIATIVNTQSGARFSQ